MWSQCQLFSFFFAKMPKHSIHILLLCLSHRNLSQFWIMSAIFNTRFVSLQGQFQRALNSAHWVHFSNTAYSSSPGLWGALPDIIHHWFNTYWAMFSNLLTVEVHVCSQLEWKAHFIHIPQMFTYGITKSTNFLPAQDITPCVSTCHFSGCTS